MEIAFKKLDNNIGKLKNRKTRKLEFIKEIGDEKKYKFILFIYQRLLSLKSMLKLCEEF